MKTKLSFLLLLFYLIGAVTQAAPTTQVIVPNALANVEGNSSVSDVLNSSSFRLQQVFDGSQFSSLGSTSFAQIKSISFRPDGASTFDVLSVFGGSTIQLSTTARSVDNLSPVFADNVGANVVTIYTGGVAFGGSSQPGATPQLFGNSIILTTPFFYSPGQGNLLLDIRGRSGQVLLPGALDAQSTIGDSVSRVFVNSELLTSGTADSLGLVAQFNIAVIPEPSTCILAMLGFAMMFILKRRQGW